MTPTDITPLHRNIGHTIGKYRVSPLTKGLDDGRWRASVSIRSGHGSATTDRVMRFEGSFATEAAAQQYARQQGLAWVSQAHGHGQPQHATGGAA